MSNIEFLRKISPKTIMGTIDEPDEKIDLYTVYGAATDTKSGESAYGPWDALVGTFEAVKIETGEVYASMQCFLPEPMGSHLINKVRGIGEGEKIEFAVTIGVKPSNKGSMGYEYVSTPIIEAEASGELSALRELVKDNIPKLPTPKAATRKVDKKGTR